MTPKKEFGIFLVFALLLSICFVGFKTLCTGLDFSGDCRVNLILYFANAMLFFLIASRLRESFLFAFLAAGLYLLHPIRAHSMTWVSQRYDSVSLFFMLAAWLAHMKERRLVSAALFILSLHFKSAAIVFPLILIGQDVLARPRSMPEKPILDRIFGCAPHFAVAFAVAAARGLPELMIAPWTWKAGGYFDHFWTNPEFFPWSVVVCAAAALSWIFRKEVPMFALGVVWFFIAMLPLFQMFPPQSVVYERFLYIPIIGLSLGAADVIMRRCVYPLWVVFLSFYGASMLMGKDSASLSSHRGRRLAAPAAAASVSAMRPAETEAQMKRPLFLPLPFPLLFSAGRMAENKSRCRRPHEFVVSKIRLISLVRGRAPPFFPRGSSI